MTISNDFWINFFANLISSGLIAAGAYFLIDNRIQNREKNRAAKYVLYVLKYAIGSLDYYQYWLNTVFDTKSKIKGWEDDFKITFGYPPYYKESMAKIWERVKNDYVLKNFEPETITNLEDGFNSFDAFFNRLTTTSSFPPGNGNKSYWLMMGDLSIENIYAKLLPVLKIALSTTNTKESINEKKWRTEALESFIEKDKNSENHYYKNMPIPTNNWKDIYNLEAIRDKVFKIIVASDSKG